MTQQAGTLPPKALLEAMQCLRMADNVGALERAESGLADARDKAPFLALASLAALRASLPQRAIPHLQALIAINPGDRAARANLANAYIQEGEVDRIGGFISPEIPPDMRLLSPGSGLYANIRGEGVTWDSASTLGRSMPPVELLEMNERRFEGPLTIVDSEGMENSVYAYSFGLIWESASGDIPLTLSVFEDAQHRPETKQQGHGVM